MAAHLGNGAEGRSHRWLIIGLAVVALVAVSLIVV